MQGLIIRVSSIQVRCQIKNANSPGCHAENRYIPFIQLSDLFLRTFSLASFKLHPPSLNSQSSNQSFFCFKEYGSFSFYTSSASPPPEPNQ
jgi:hypothetical protein